MSIEDHELIRLQAAAKAARERFEKLTHFGADAALLKHAGDLSREADAALAAHIKKNPTL